MKKHIMSVLVNNHMGVLSRVSGLFSRRGYSIDSLAVGSTEVENISRITISVTCEEDVFEQIKNQLAKLVDVLTIMEIDSDDAVIRELALIKIDATHRKRAEIIEIANIFRARIIDVSNDTLMLEITGNENKISAIISMLEEFGVKEVIRTGVIAINRGAMELKNY